MATKQLARQLGILRRSSKSSPGDQNHSGPKQRQEFDYLIVIDFESTCWRDGRTHYSQEIIEFPAVLLNTSNGEIESEFHMYVQPQEHPILSEFCTELTGITQNQVDEGVPLPICLSQFSKWIQKIQKEKKVVFDSVRSNVAASGGKLCAFVTWSDWDLGVCLQYECKRKQLRKPDILNSWIDLRATYKLFYSRKPQGLNGALQDVGIIFAGREHSGLDDARNTARLAWRMIGDGCGMRITKSLDKVRGFFLLGTYPRRTQTEFLRAKPTEGSPLGSNDGAKTSDLDKNRDCEGTAVIKGDTGEGQQESEPVLLYGSIPTTSRKGSKPSGYSRVQSYSTALAGRLGSPIGCLQPPSFGIQSGLSNGHLMANPPTQNAGLVLVSTTLSSISVSEVDVGTTSDCLSMLADWEDFALIPESQHEQGSECPQFKDDSDIKSSPVSGEGSDSSESDTTNLQYESVAEVTLNGDLSKSVVYKSPNTTIYHKGTAPSKPSNTSVFKLPSAKTNAGPLTLSGARLASSASEAPKRKPSSPQPVPPAKKPPFIVYEDKGAPSANSSRSSGSPRVPCGILNSSINQKLSSRCAEAGKVTPPLCKCGRRARRLHVSKGGPNQGKVFYSCPTGKQEGSRKGCGYFKWEHTLRQEKLTLPSPASSPVGLPSPGTILHSLGNVQKKCLGLRPSMRT
ncbi:PREDICTED: ERI1 exoribonuclease 2 [Gekko japonicus]|uniref:ERI1 exoribonuclease 2 n=1 Tax=Gekko japonicus TaxID=146911 RepID=A0ABM1KD16_GEKJA|nr:PREDICTED: ERI1 exoribonuclease 2 [Gekko japonicus]